jgi:hypothetical protein
MSISGVSVDMAAPAPSQADQDLRLAYEGNLATFMDRLQALSVEKGRADAAKASAESALADLQLGQSAKDAAAEAERNRKESEAQLAAAQMILTQAKADGNAMAVKAQQLHDEAAADRAKAAQELAALQDERKQIAADCAAAARLGEQHEAARQKFEAKFADLKKCFDMVVGLNDAFEKRVFIMDEIEASLDRRAAIFGRAMVSAA